MIKALKLYSAIVILIIGVICVVISEIVQESHPITYKWLLAGAGIACFASALLFLLPFFRAKKVDPDGKLVNLTPIGEKPEEALENVLISESEEKLIQDSQPSNVK